MNRRNFMVGLGTVATISGVASVTAASLTEDFEAGADFQVIVDEELTVRPGDLFQDDDLTEESDLDGEDRLVEEPIDFEDLESDDFDDDDEGTLLYINLDGPDGDFDEEELPENDELEIELAVLNDNEENPPAYENLLEIENSGATDQTVGIEYEYGVDVDTTDLSDYNYDETDDGEGIEPDTVAELFEFETDEGFLSPNVGEDEDDPDDAGEVEIEPGTLQIDLNINLETETAEDIADAVGAEDGIFDGGTTENVDLLDSIHVGLIDNGGD